MHSACLFLLYSSSWFLRSLQEFPKFCTAVILMEHHQYQIHVSVFQKTVEISGFFVISGIHDIDFPINRREIIGHGIFQRIFQDQNALIHFGVFVDDSIIAAIHGCQIVIIDFRGLWIHQTRTNDGFARYGLGRSQHDVIR